MEENEEQVYLRVKAKRDEYRRRCASAHLSNYITPQQDIDGKNMEDYCKHYEDRHGIPRT
ncbi:hypothetical protein IC229_33270 [Spirosoma sp. BT702]|uniref:Uncharacterized protein n=1 Tax=Spirosoma profusum TaxID=2771354 RepID=A0A927AW61_9BACT|nr:hypothetical protein [Spirosoma profusum]MBD2705527.1 hypothetical protein [Spirosoma profusum]